MGRLASSSPLPDGLKRGDVFKIRGEDYLLTSFDKRSMNVRLRPKIGSKDINIPLNDLLEWLKSDAISRTPGVNSNTRNCIRLASLTHIERLGWIMRCDYVKPLLAYGKGETTRQLVNKYIDKTFDRRSRSAQNKSINKETRPGTSTVYMWLKLVRENDYLTAVLAFKEHRHKARKDRLDPIVSEIVESAIDYYLSPESANLFDSYVIVENRIKELNACRHKGAELLEIPSKTTIRKRLLARNKMDVDAKRDGVEKVIKKYNHGGKTDYGHFIGSRVEGDTNYIDCLVYDPVIDFTYRPLLLLFIDCYTRAVVGYEVSYLQRGSQKLAKAMTNMMSTNDTACYSCVPILVVVDNGKEFDNNTLLHIQDRMNIQFLFSPPYSPNCKAMIERFWGTLNKILLHKMKGTTKGSIEKRGYYESEKLATYTMQELTAYIDRAINIYHHTPHSSTVLAPKTMWEDAALRLPPTVYERDTIITLGCKYVRCGVTKGRVGFEYLEWKNSAMPENFNNEQVIVCINESDLTNVWVINPLDEDDIYILDPVDRELQTGLSLDFWRSYRKQLQEREAQTGNREKASSLRYELIQELYAEAQTGKGKTKRTRARLAHAATNQIERHSQSITASQKGSGPKNKLVTAPKDTPKPKSSDYGIE
ncbi:MAG: DDE-type integrase/transposase/recombinase [Gammaproteobacteria bacterium]|nr:DDE-type integrase/transposase/recombinase [Gammaproteobacteria bacterium]MBU1832521.1 DDE-type integrase/transposase/recombinase [Gammaproteobacteria bacterium]